MTEAAATSRGVEPLMDGDAGEDELQKQSETCHGLVVKIHVQV